MNVFTNALTIFWAVALSAGLAVAQSDNDYLCAPASSNPRVCNSLPHCYYQPGSCLSRGEQPDYLCAPASTNANVCNSLPYCYFSPGICKGR